jgi:CheY-specific phosphatase CheX
MSGLASLREWVSAAEAAAAEVATTALSCSEVQLATRSTQPPQSLFGAYVPLVASDCQAQIGIVAEWPACQSLARALFGMDRDAELDADSDVGDALGEIANMVAGCVKTRMNGRVPGLNTGLPLCVSGHVEPSTGAEHATLVLSFDGVLASVIVLLSPNAEAPSARTRAQSRALPKVG